MRIEDIRISYYSTGSLCDYMENVKHIKELPFLSVVQATEGYYEIGIGSAKTIALSGGGSAFIAPPYKTQQIIHHNSRITGRIKAHWIFLGVIVNNRYLLSDCYDFPTELPREYRDYFNNRLSIIESEENLCKIMSCIYDIVGMLIEVGTEKMIKSEFGLNVRDYVERHYSETLTPQMLADKLNISISTLFRKIKNEFGITPANYINQVRLMQAIILLETTDLPITRIALETGMYDQPYFTKLFKKRFSLSPVQYRKAYRNKETQVL